MKTLTIRGITPEISRRLTERAVKNRASLNKTVLSVLDEALGRSKPIFREYHDLDHLAGIWSDKESRKFDNLNAKSRVIDKELQS